jgi:hypothetical protein
MKERLVIITTARAVALAHALAGHDIDVIITDENYYPEKPDLKMLREEPAAPDDRPEPRRSRLTPRGGRSDDWKGKYRFG